MNSLANIRVVLVQTWHPGNIGSAARAMKTMGLSDLWLVAPKSFPDPRATALATEAGDVLAAATVVDSLAEAIADCVLTIASSARPRSKEVPALDIDQVVQKTVDATSSGKVALVFGPERAGLTTADVDQCQHRAALPTAADCRSVNLAQAVQLFAYALRRGARTLPPTAPIDLASSGQREAVIEAWDHALRRLNFAPSEVAKMMPRYRELLQRAEPTVREVKLLRGMLARIDQRTLEPDRPEYK